jgi:hypothetical protein
MSIDGIRRKLFQPYDGSFLGAIYFATVVWPTSIPSSSGFTMNPWRSSQRVGNAHLENEPSNVCGDLWPATVLW